MLHGSAPLIPFANRIRRGKYSFLGKEYALPTNTRDGNAIHGCLYDIPWQVTSKEAGDNAANLTCEHVLKETDLHGYPFRLVAKIVFRLSSKGFMVATTVANIGEVKLPLTMGFHPYLKAGPARDVRIDRYRLVVPAQKRLRLVNMIPIGECEPVKGTAYDFRTPREIGEVHFDDGFTALTYHGGVASSLIWNDSQGFGVELWQDEAYGFLQVYTPPHRRSIAIEPMSGAADAFNNGMGLRVLESGESFQASYGLRTPASIASTG